MRIFITGICGFVGSTLARGLRETLPGSEITGIDNFLRRGSEQNLEPLGHLGIRVYRGDIRNADDLPQVPRCDWVIDAAANPSVLAGVDGKTSSRELLDHNLGGTIQLLELCKSWQAGFVLLSTSRVYSIHALSALPVERHGAAMRLKAGAVLPVGASEHGISEDFSTQPPLSLYGASKLTSEILALEYGLAFGLPVFINRCGVLAGPGQFGKIDQGIFSFWIHSYAAHRPLKYIGFGGTGAQVRDCLHARDLVPLVLAQLQQPVGNRPRVLNFSGGLANSASLKELSDWCEQRFGPHAIGAELADRPFDIPWIVLDSRRGQESWSWKPQTPLHAIWEEIAQHAEQNPKWLDLVG